MIWIPGHCETLYQGLSSRRTSGVIPRSNQHISNSSFFPLLKQLIWFYAALCIWSSLLIAGKDVWLSPGSSLHSRKPKRLAQSLTTLYIVLHVFMMSLPSFSSSCAYAAICGMFCYCMLLLFTFLAFELAIASLLLYSILLFMTLAFFWPTPGI